ncbi:hypothetical protein D9611_013397 [Ephemerocybe angulata]|uniref:Uncharacterized protein n=1 Tax=Ephemerocybe angulata TaxID=980116 RepID=A0A8H5BUM0_9AGAR|nr:hypothetical protein D9611_013397 [Tulosesus angulatus]
MPKQSPIKGLPATKSLPIIPPIVPEADPNVPVPPPARPVRGKGAATTVPPAAPTTATATSSKAYGKKKAKTIVQEDTIPHIAPNTAPESSIAPALRSVNAKISLVNKRIDELEAVRLADIAARLHKVEEDDVVILADRLDIVETSNEGFGERLSKLEKASESMWTRMNDMQANVSRIDSTVNKMKDEVGLALDTANWARTTADEIQDSVDHAKEDISSIYPAVQSLEALNGEMSELRGRVDFLSGSVNAVRGSITNISKVSGSAPVAPSFPTTTHSPPNPHYLANPSPPSALPIRTPQLRPSRDLPYRAAREARAATGPPAYQADQPALVLYGPHSNLLHDGNHHAAVIEILIAYNSTAFGKASIQSTRSVACDHYSIKFHNRRSAEAFVACVAHNPPVPGAIAHISNN